MSVIPTLDGRRLYRTYPPTANEAFDVIVVGSGMGGMSCAAALSRLGRRVLVLEQHYLPGGYTHMFGRKGFQWDVGVHALGELHEGGQVAKMLAWLAEEEVPMVSLGDPYDRFRFPDGLEIDFPPSQEALIETLHARFPDQGAALDRYFALSRGIARMATVHFGLRSMPRWLERAGTGLLGLVSRDWFSATVEDLLDEAGVEGDLRSVLTAQWGYHGSLPGEASAVIQCLINAHFARGAWYPVGGAKSLATALLGTVVRHGGEVLCRADVSQILVEGGRARGVVMADGTELRAGAVICAAGAHTAVKRLVPESLRDSDWGRAILEVSPSPSYLCLNLGFEGDISAGGASSANLWLFNTWKREQEAWDPRTESEPHILYVSFPSLKDSLHEPGESLRHTGEAVTFVPWDLFEPWAGSTHGDRDAGYLALKKNITDKLLTQLRCAIPEVMQHLVLSELSTPLTAEHFVRATRGAIYGLDASTSRFSCPALRSRTPLPDFYMTGVDVMTTGVAGALISGLLTAAVLDKRAYLPCL
jgi:all-trans-retinol 13,14-reductase